MITETGKVVAVKDGRVWVQTIRQSACSTCSARSGCGQRVLAAATSGRANQVLVTNSVNAVVGDEVTLGIDERALLGASMLAYAIPLVLLVVASVAGHSLSGGEDLWAIVGAVLGLGAGFFIGRGLHARSGDAYEPRLLRVNRIPSGAGR
ncbi:MULTISPECIES: SoxR reducing system RseC family protein [Marinobacter]|uniref:SoxR reducing system RseC family protein n=1 Tax=Marinobacter suaedae TaxID=3057675 RepID=A0ABT8W3Y2_9GAMM|nr:MULTISPECIES: SoxR reducing system RseC family protein [unclassified Marinobacter]MBZ2167306.1 SoxR reducing system RseC family protein [Marinobacter sp. F4216]MDO3722954.1 SoxR reducing system RseC family protein [Marinobacter sp. chi1]